MSFGFLGIQFGYALQGGFMSRIFQTLGAQGVREAGFATVRSMGDQFFDEFLAGA